jgi:hypothetical protein
MISGPTTIAATAGSQIADESQRGKFIPSDLVPASCEEFSNPSMSLSLCVERVAGGFPSVEEKPDWPMRLALSGGVAVVVSFFFSVVLGLATIVGRPSQ